MKVSIDTTEDSHETIRATIELLQSHLRSKGATNITTNYSQEYSQPSFPSEDRLAKKIARAQEKQQSYESATPMMGMFDAPPTTPSDSPEPEETPDEPKIQFL